MSWFDIVVIVILVYSTFKGASRGLVTQLAWIVALVACFAFAESFSLKLAPQIQTMFPQVEPPLDRWIAMFILYMGFAFVSFGLARVLRGWLEKAKFQDFDKHLGGILGLVKGVIICMVLVFFAVTLSDSMRQTVLASHSGHAAAKIMQTLEPVMPKELPNVITTALARLNHDDFHNDELGGEQGGLDGFVDDVLDLGQGRANGNANNNGVAEGNGGGGFIDDLFNFGQGGDKTPDNATGGTNQPVTGSNPAGGNQSTGTSLNDFIRGLPTSIGNDIKRSALTALQNSTPEEQQRLKQSLIEQLRSTNSGTDRTQLIGGVLQNWIGKTIGGGTTNGGSGTRPSTPVNPNPFGPDTGNYGNTGNQSPVATNYGATVNKFLTSIGEIYSSRPDAQQAFTNNITAKLAGVPEQVQALVLQDWYADLMPGQDDPDPQTRLRTDLDVRILHQLQAVGISPTRLSNALQQRMGQAARQ